MRQSDTTDKRLRILPLIDANSSIIRELQNEFLGLLRNSISLSFQHKIKFVKKLDSLTEEKLRIGIEALRKEEGIKQRHSKQYSNLLELSHIQWPLVLKEAKAIKKAQ